MKLKTWRKKKHWTQEQLVERLLEFARQFDPKGDYELSQTALSAWESGTMPRKKWFPIIVEFTNHSVKANDWVPDACA